MPSRLPSIEDCYALLDEHQVPPNIVQHAEAVARVTVFLAERLVKAGLPVDVALAQRGALLHDLDKLMELAPGQWHGERGAEIVRQRGYPEVADIVGKHALGVPGSASFEGWTWEERLVHYADKLCLETRIVSLSERMAGLKARYPQKAETFDRYQRYEVALEEEILKAVGMSPEQLLAALDIMAQKSH